MPPRGIASGAQRTGTSSTRSARRRGLDRLVVRRHMTAVADMTEDEAAELGPLVKEVSRVVQEVVDCDKTYVVQFAEHQDHRHVHVHVIPRARDLPHEYQGPRVFSLLGVPDDLAVSAERMTAIAQQLDVQLQI